MPLEPFTALALAGNIIQFVDFGTKIIATARRSYKSPDGMLPENLEVVQVTTELERLTIIICAPLLIGPSTEEASEEQSAFQQISQMCNEVSREIKNQIAKLTSDKPQLNSGEREKLHHKFRSFRIAIRGAWTEAERSALLKRLDIIRNTLELQILVRLR